MSGAETGPRQDAAVAPGGSDDIDEPGGVRPARWDERVAMATTLAHAFDGDPVMAWLVGGGQRHPARLCRFYLAEARQHLRLGGAWTDSDLGSAALWAPPGRWRSTVGDFLRMAPAMASAIRGRLPRALRLAKAMEDAHPREPHWYLGFLGTDPHHRGQGRGRRLMAPVLDRCDHQGLGAYLESSKESNIPYYERSGFRVTGEIRMPDGPSLWPMWRDPREPSPPPT